MSDIIETAIPIAGGLYASYLGYRKMPEHRYARTFRVLGPVLLFVGLATLFRALGRYFS